MSKDQKQYSELQGGVGRAVHFRTERFRSRALLGELSPELWVGDARARLYDVSMNGLSFYVPPSEAPGDGLEVPIRLLLDGEEGFRGSARVVRTDVEGGLVKIGATIVSGFIDIPRLVSLHDNAAFERSVSAGSRRYSSVPADYSASVHAASVFLAHWSRLLDERERRLVDDGA
ncbi:MAG: hypothetical protein H6697_10300 [Myxococcales bacterium]|nr:hypothetical protein [Myxococcales bacterium]